MSALTQYFNSDQMKTDVAIDQADLSSAMAQHASLYIGYVENCAKARRQYEQWKSALEMLEAQLDGEIRSAAADEGKKVTEASIKASINQNPRWKAASATVIDAQMMWKITEGYLSAFEQRKDMLLQLARGQLREMEGQVRLTPHPAATAAAAERVLNALGQQAAKAA